MRKISSCLQFHCEKRPITNYTPEVIGAAIGKAETRSGYQILHRARGPHFVGFGLGQYPCRRVDGDAADVAADEFDLARMQAAADVDAETVHLAAGRAGAMDSARRAIEGGEEAVACALDGASP